MEKIVGECSQCGGDVTVPDIWYGTVPPKPTCKSCGAVARSGPIIETKPVRSRYTAPFTN